MVKIDEKQIAKIAKILKESPESGQGLNFYSYIKDSKEIVDSEKFPPLNHPQTINFFFFAVMHDYGFWYGDDKGYHAPLYGVVNGEKAKGSDLLWKACVRALHRDSVFFEPAYLSELKPCELVEVFSDDKEPIVWPDFEARFKMTRAFGRWFGIEKITAKDVVASANSQKESLFSFLSLLRFIPGYNRDYLEKKNMLLAMALANRPEKFLKVNDPDRWMPIVDYHLMRVGLRLGIVKILDAKILKKVINREWVDVYAEREIRCLTHKAIQELIKQSGRPMSFIDEKMWMSRKYCPEIEEPNCAKCVFDLVCKKRVDLFQPVFRTTAY
jgi:hypothetical protein